MKKIAVIGAGTAGLITTMKLCNLLEESYEINLIHSDSIDIIGVGESTLVDFPAVLESCVDYEHFLDREELNSTTKYGVKFKDWSQDDFFITFSSGSHALQFDTNNFKSYVIPKLSERYENFYEIKKEVKNIESKGLFSEVIVEFEDGNLTFDYVIDCRGFPKDYSDYKIVDNVYLNSAIVFSSETKTNKEFTYHIAHKNGWMFGVPLNNKIGFGYLYNDEFCTKEECLNDIKDVMNKFNNSEDLDIEFLDNSYKEYKFKNYYKESFKNNDNNIFVNGNMALFFEPIQATSLLCYSSIANYIIHSIFYQETAFLLDEAYKKLIEESLLFINLHYITGSGYPSPFWSYACDKSFKFIESYNLLNYQWDILLDTEDYKKKMYSKFLG